MHVIYPLSRSRWPRRLWRRSAAARLLGLRVRILPRAWKCVSCKCCVLSVEVPAPGRSLVQRSPTEYGVSKRYHGTSTLRRPGPTRGCQAINKYPLYFESINESYADLMFKSLAHSTKDCHETFLLYITFLVTDIPMVINIINKHKQPHTEVQTTYLTVILSFFSFAIKIFVYFSYFHKSY
jgi:hypothetical protein